MSADPGAYQSCLIDPEKPTIKQRRGWLMGSLLR